MRVQPMTTIVPVKKVEKKDSNPRPLVIEQREPYKEVSMRDFYYYVPLETVPKRKELARKNGEIDYDKLK